MVLKFAAVKGDANSHGAGALTDSTCVASVKVNGIAIATVKDGGGAADDDLCPDKGGSHCAPGPNSGSSTVFAGGSAVHRDGDGRVCGATTNGSSPNVRIG